MTKNLSPKDIIALGFMTFALFVGAGNIIFPTGGAAVRRTFVAGRPGFMVTAVALPVIAVIALARVGGSISLLTGPIGRTAGLLLATVCYLALGPLFATPRTANVFSPSASRPSPATAPCRSSSTACCSLPGDDRLAVSRPVAR